MERKIRIGALNYLNVQPLLYGINHHPVIEQVELTYTYPSLIAKALQNDEADLGIVSTAAILTIPNGHIVSEYGICADDSVASVCIFSEVPMEQVEMVYLDYQSRTSVRLAEVLLAEYWHKNVTFLQADEHFIDKISGTTAGVIIGDRTFKARKRFKYVYDLAHYWKLLTGLPFVFAAWIANKKLPADFLKSFDEANAYGVAHIPEVVKLFPNPDYDVAQYFEKDIKYHMTEDMHRGLDLFLSYLKR